MSLALVTGGSGGIGAAVVCALHDAGHEVVFTHIGQSVEADALCKTCGPKVRAVESDTSKEEAVTQLHAEFQPTIFVHCAGITRDKPIWKQEASDFDAVMGVNLRGAWLQARAVASHMRAAEWGRIVLIGSINGTRGKFGQTTYSASKSGLHGLAKSLAKELGSKGVTVNVVEPGWIETPMTAQIPQQYAAAARKETVTGRLGTPQDIADTVRYLVSEGAAHLTGNILRVDGGQSL
ncbi:MAG: SDR family oxidoreductase [Planctomycetota bacterium]